VFTRAPRHFKTCSANIYPKQKTAGCCSQMQAAYREVDWPEMGLRGTGCARDERCAGCGRLLGLLRLASPRFAPLRLASRLRMSGCTRRHRQIARTTAPMQCVLLERFFFVVINRYGVLMDVYFRSRWSVGRVVNENYYFNFFRKSFNGNI